MDDKFRCTEDGGASMMVNELNQSKSGYQIPKKRVNIRLSGEELLPTCYQSDKVGVRGIAELEKRLMMLEKWANRAIAAEKEGAQSEEALVLRYGESVDKTTAGHILGVTRSTVYAMIADGRVQTCSDGRRVSVRSIARYLE